MNSMSVTEEEGGRLNAFAKEPSIEIVEQNASPSKLSWLIIGLGGLLLIALISFTVSIS